MMWVITGKLPCTQLASCRGQGDSQPGPWADDQSQIGWEARQWACPLNNHTDPFRGQICGAFSFTKQFSDSDTSWVSFN